MSRELLKKSCRNGVSVHYILAYACRIRSCGLDGYNKRQRRAFDARLCRCLIDRFASERIFYSEGEIEESVSVYARNKVDRRLIVYRKCDRSRRNFVFEAYDAVYTQSECVGVHTYMQTGAVIEIEIGVDDLCRPFIQSGNRKTGIPVVP